MKIYFAVTGPNELIYLPKNKIRTLLMSYHYYYNSAQLIRDLRKKNDIFIDSGAFSADNAKVKINIDDYCRFIKNTGVRTYAGLDVIGDAEKTMNNQKYMEDKGLNPIPTFHMGEKIDNLLYLVENYSYIAIGGMVFNENVESWLDCIWKEMFNINKNIKCHAFGMTNTKLMSKYPWYSVDSSSFKSGKRFGRLILYNELKNNFVSLNYNEWIKKYAELTFNNDILTNTKFRNEITDVLSAKGYKKYENNINNINKKTNNYSYINAQKSLFDL